MILIILLGAIAGTLVGILPGLGSSAGLALLFPVTLGMEASMALVFLASIYLGSMYGGRVTSILINIPGDAAAIVSTFDGYPMMTQGRGGIALGISAVSSFIAGVISLLILAIFAPLLADLALYFAAPEYFALILFGIAAIASLTDRGYLKSIIMAVLGFLLSTIGLDFISGTGRYEYSPHLIEGLDFVAVIIGLYAIGEILFNIERSFKLNMKKGNMKLGNIFPSWRDIKGTFASTIRGTGIGTFFGVLPGAGASLSTFLSYSVEKGQSKEPDKFGKGKMEGLAGPEAANNASVGGSLIPTFALGIPGSATTAILLGVLIIYGLQPGPRIFDTSPDVVWTIIVGLFIANILLLFANIFLVPSFIKMMYYGQWYLNGIVVFICVIGAFSLAYTVFNVWVAIAFGILGFFFKKLDYPTAPFILALILGPLAEDSFRQALIMSHGDFSIFIARPTSLIIMIAAVLFLLYPIVKQLISKKKS
ncbi:tripartite tricarboxylate transporter permease [Salicibibacter cibarius]|uniref:Tripartite tricarboxylate transporter permease n=2 Tax=Salicibibacter cibarius TaxID=2743000 RepID=A0A7T6Z7S4_9BACI|nr:tripartite tricarboxylate transporter permease [Salicibibacter cibarius]QQK78428.1 tripartite tricarboxylate transporter permease [Salicibibacter cibarius]